MAHRVRPGLQKMLREVGCYVFHIGGAQRLASGEELQKFLSQSVAASGGQCV
jgi:hypothetical protein